jgi:4-amino-4-deoxy-L-arabinose transferase-like glycosyltransferase
MNMLRRLRFAHFLRLTAAALYLVNSLDWLLRGETSITRWLWGLSMILFLVSLAPVREPSTRSERPDDISRLTTLFLLPLVVAVAFILRLVNVANVPLDVHGDFTSVGLVARDILQGRVAGVVATGWYDQPMVAFAQPTFTMWLFGDDLFGVNFEAVICGSLIVIGIYLLTQLSFNRSTALMAAAVSAVGYTDIHFSRVTAYIDPVPWLVFGFYFLLRAVRDGGEVRAGLAGAFIAIAFEMYYSGRLAALVLALFLAYLALFHRSLLLARRRELLLFLAAGLLATGPLLFFHLRHLGSFMSRTQQVFIFTPGNMAHLLNKYQTQSAWHVIAEQAWRSLLTFNYTGDSSTQFGFRHPMINPILAPLFVFGFGLTLLRVRTPPYAFLALWLVTGVVVGSILTIDAPFWPRLVVLLPCVAILTAVGLSKASSSLLALFRNPVRAEMVLAAALTVLVFVGYQNWQWYYHGSESTSIAPIAWVGRLIEKSPPGTRYCMVRGPLDFADRVPQFLGKGHDMLDVPSEELEQYKQRCVAEGRVWVIIRPFHDQVLASLNREWPEARQERHDFPSGEPGPIFWYPPAAARSQAPPARQ